jgi:exopolysaccharide biosynthesis polyprenyl glycosylphosphotransferase
MQSRTLTPVRIPSATLSKSVADQIWAWCGFLVVMGTSFLTLALLSEGTLGEIIQSAWVMLLGSVIAFLVTAVLLDRTLRYPGSRSSLVTIPLALLPLLILVAIIALTRSYYSRPFLLVDGSLTMIWAFTRYRASRRPHARRLAVIPIGDRAILEDIPAVRFVTLKKPGNFTRTSFDGIVLDMHADIPQEWVKFLADSVMQQIRIYHTASLVESIAGRVSLQHLAALHVDNLQPMPWFNPLKRGTDLLVTILAAPFLLAIGLLLAILIRLESKGPAIYRQRRVSAKGKAFTLLKFRSMRADAEVDGAQFTTENDPRITRLGHFMRKTRLDELPQFWNILKGDMSLVGPRPERPNFVEQYEREIPNYNLRQIARPGLTGWAQIETGYSSDTAGTIRKLERDLYYVKYRSIALDTYIIYRTIRTVFFGSGAR